jgi:hypothetical protein
VSDTWQGEGWWIASDGKWYPPESHPDAGAPPAPVPAAPTTAAPAAPASSAPGAPASRWLGRSVPPPARATTLEESPASPPTTQTAATPPSTSASASTTSTSRRWSKPQAATTAVTPPAAVAPVTYPLLDAPAARRGPPPQRPVAIWVFISIGAVVVTLVIAFLLIHSSGGVLAAENGTITVIYRTTGRPTFSGTINGTPLTGKLTSTSSITAPSDNGLITATTQSFVYKGRYGGDSYVLHVSLTTADSPGVDSLGSQLNEWQVTGTDGQNRVAGTVEFNGSYDNDLSMQVPFSGHIGSQIVNGNAVVTEKRAGAVRVTVSYINLP